jgi:hypothetical protein
MQSFGRKHVRHQIATGMILLAVIMAAGCAPKATGTIDVPEGEAIKVNGSQGTYGVYEKVPAAVLKSGYSADFAYTVKVQKVLNTRIVLGEITSPTDLSSQVPEHPPIYFYLCQPLSTKAEKLSDGTVVYNGTGYPPIIIGQEYNVVGTLQPQWQDWPFVYVSGPLAFNKKTTSQ